MPFHLSWTMLTPAVIQNAASICPLAFNNYRISIGGNNRKLELLIYWTRIKLHKEDK